MKTLTKVIQAGVILSMLVALIELTLQTMLLNIVDRSERGEDITTEAAQHDSWTVAAVGTGLALYVPIAIMVLVWVYKSNKRLHQSGIKDMEFTPGWAVAWWFVPIANLVRPAEIMADLWRGTFTKTGNARKKFTKSPRSISVWWICWVFSGIATRLSGMLIAPDMPTFNDFRNSAYLEILSCILLIISGITFIRLVGAISDAHERGPVSPESLSSPTG